MPLAALLLPLLAAAQASAVPLPPARPPIVVTGRGGVPFISPMGEPIRARTPNEDTLARWFGQADRNRDGVLTPDELVADAERYFAILDTNRDGQIDPEELIHYEWTVAPEIQVNSRLRRAARSGRSPAKPKADADDESGQSRAQARSRAQHGRRPAGRGALCAAQHAGAGRRRRYRLQPRDHIAGVPPGRARPFPAARQERARAD